MRDMTLLAMALASLLMAALTGPARAQPGEAIQPQSTLRIAVGRWDPVTETYTAWPDLGGEYVVGSDGVLDLPMAGSLAVTDLVPTELGDEIASRLGRRMGLDGQVSAAVSVIAREPIYVTGGVQAPGAYGYSPRLTVLQAVSLAGGLTSTGAAFLRSERNALGTMGEYRVLELSLLRNLATLARLEAERAETSRIETPEEVAAAAMGAELMAQERAIREARDAALDSNLRQLDDLEALLRERIERIDTQIALRDRQLELAREELDSAASLVERGLSVESRRTSLEQRVADQEVRRLELETAKLNAEQRLNELGRDRADLINERRKMLVEQIGAIRLETEKLRVRMQTQAALYAEALRYGDGFVSMERTDPATYEITRRDGDGVSVIEASEETPMRPGDVLRVALSGPGAVMIPQADRPGSIGGPDLPEALATD